MLNHTPTKTCKRCQNNYPKNNEYFYSYNDKKGKLTYNSYCKNCNKYNSRQWHNNNPEMAAAYNAKYRKENPEVTKLKSYHYDVKVGVYMVKNVITGETYIGASKNMRARVAHHFTPSETRSNVFLNKSINTYPKQAFVWGVLTYCTPEVLYERETFYIQNLKPTWNRRKVK